MNYKILLFKKQVELFLMFPFVWLGILAGMIFKLKTRHRHFLFFPSKDVGGSIKVNADIANCLKHLNPLIIFTKRPKNNKFSNLYQIEGVTTLNLYKYIDYKPLHFINFFFRGVLSSWINAVNNPVIFGGECMYFYKVLPHLKRESSRIELMHLDTWLKYTLAFIMEIDVRICSSHSLMRGMKNIYDIYEIDKSYYEKIILVDNKIDIPPLIEPNDAPVIDVLFIGRNSPQKRVHLAVAIAKQIHQVNKQIHFSFVGNLTPYFEDEMKEYSTFYGEVADKEKLAEIYKRSSVLLVTSQFEGLPIVVMEMMGRAKVVLSTAVGGIPDYIIHEFSGLLIHEEQEKEIIIQAVSLLEILYSDKDLRIGLGMNAYDYAINHFSQEIFCKKYQEILIP